MKTSINYFVTSAKEALERSYRHSHITNLAPTFALQPKVEFFRYRNLITLLIIAFVIIFSVLTQPAMAKNAGRVSGSGTMIPSTLSVETWRNGFMVDAKKKSHDNISGRLIETNIFRIPAGYGNFSLLADGLLDGSVTDIKFYKDIDRNNVVCLKGTLTNAYISFFTIPDPDGRDGKFLFVPNPLNVVADPVNGIYVNTGNEFRVFLKDIKKDNANIFTPPYDARTEYEGLFGPAPACPDLLPNDINFNVEVTNLTI